MSTSVRRVLILEDNAALATVLKFNLQRAAFDVVEAGNGREGWDLIQNDQFDLIITDHQMPEMTGIEFCEKMRTLDNYRDTPVIMLTAKGLELDLADLEQRLGISAAFPKPYSPQQVIRTAESLLETTVDCPQ